MKLPLILLTLFMFLTTAPLIGQANSYTDKLTAQLDRLEIRHTVTSKGNVKIQFTLGDNRTQIVFIYAKKYTYKNTEVREIKSVAAGVVDKFDFGESLLVRLMEENFNNNVGAWQLNTASSERNYLEFGLRIPTNASDEDLLTYLKLAGGKADALELEITAADEF